VNLRRVSAQLARVRQPMDEQEKILTDDRWPLPKYSEMLFVM
jgi:glutamine synthetase type III